MNWEKAKGGTEAFTERETLIDGETALEFDVETAKEQEAGSGSKRSAWLLRSAVVFAISAVAATATFCTWRSTRKLDLVAPAEATEKNTMFPDLQGSDGMAYYKPNSKISLSEWWHSCPYQHMHSLWNGCACNSGYVYQKKDSWRAVGSAAAQGAAQGGARARGNAKARGGKAALGAGKEAAAAEYSTQTKDGRCLSISSLRSTTDLSASEIRTLRR